MAAYTLRTDTLETANMVDTSRVELARNTLTLVNLCRKWTQGNEKKVSSDPAVEIYPTQEGIYAETGV